MSKQIDEGFTVILAHAGNIKRNAINLELSLSLIIVELGLIESDEFKDDHGDGEDICLIDIILDIIFQLVNVVELLGGKDVVFNLRTLSRYLEV